MSQSSGTTPAGTGATYIPLDRTAEPTNVQVTVNGTVTFTVDWTVDSILMGAAGGSNPVNVREGSVAAASATWNNLIASGSADANAQISYPVAALRINITGGTGSVNWKIIQEPNYPMYGR